MNVQDPLPATKRETVIFHLHDHSTGFQKRKKTDALVPTVRVCNRDLGSWKAPGTSEYLARKG